MSDRSAVTILDAMGDPNLFGPWFRDPATWAAWRAFLAALFGLPMDDDMRAIYRDCTGRKEVPQSPAREGWLIVGRRGGKSLVLALVAVFLACFRDYRPHLGPGERATVMVIAADRRQARVILRYVGGLLHGVPMLARLIERETAEAFDLANRVTVEVHTASFRTVRGYSIAAALLDEAAFWPTGDAAEPDTEIINAIRPALATIPGAMLLAASSPYARRGALWEAYRKHFGKAGPILAWKADTRTMNPTVPERVIAEAYEADAASAAAEYGANFRRDIEAFLAIEAIEACQRSGPLELPPVAGTTYVAFVDPSGGSSDSMTLAIGHRAPDGLAVVDVVRERRPPFSPESVVEEFAELLRSYGVSKVTGDRYAGEWPRERFFVHGVRYDPAAKVKSDLYLGLLAAVNSGRVELPADTRLAAQLVGLERRTARGGRDSIDHAPGAHDDVANAVAGALALAVEPQPRTTVSYVLGLY